MGKTTRKGKQISQHSTRPITRETTRSLNHFSKEQVEFMKTKTIMT
jgi:hypothetical protein